MKYNINLIDPYCMYVVKDLYSLYQTCNSSSSILDNHLWKLSIYKTLPDVKVFMNKFLHSCTDRELKLILLLIFDRRNAKKVIEENNNNRLKSIYDSITIVNCLFNSLPKSQVLSPIKAQKQIPLSKHKIVLQQVYDMGMEILDYYFIPPVKDEFLLIDYPNKLGSPYRGRFGRMSSYKLPPSKLFKAAMPGVYLNSPSSMFPLKRPFRENCLYPIIENDIILDGNRPNIRLRDIMYARDINSCNGYIRRSERKRSLLGLSDYEFINLLHKPIDKIDEFDLDKVYTILEYYKSETFNITYVKENILAFVNFKGEDFSSLKVINSYNRTHNQFMHRDLRYQFHSDHTY